MTTDEKIDGMIEVLKAFKEGKTIQVKGNSALEWHDTKSPYWNFVFCEFRIKPKELSVIEKQITEQLDILFSGSLEQIEIDKGELWFRYDGRTVWFEENRIMFYTGKLGLVLRLSYKELDAISSLYKIRKHPDFLSIVQQYIETKKRMLKLVTDEELEIINKHSLIWLKPKNTNDSKNIHWIWPHELHKHHYEFELKFNPDTKCWEDWSEVTK